MVPQEFQEWINIELRRFFTGKSKSLSAQDPRISELVSQIAGVTLRGGDRMRPYFCYLGYHAAQKQSSAHNSRPKALLPMLLALEVFHTFALVHDDIIDQDKVRRGGPTIHAYFTQNLRNANLATSLAILAGDLCFVWSQELFDRITPPDPRARVIFNQLREEVASGQVSDVWGMKGAAVEEIRAMYLRKTGNYTVTKPLLMGAYFGQGSQEIVKCLSKYGEVMGLAFQLKDDLLGIFGDEVVTGKSTLTDIREGKWTLLIADTYQKLTKHEQKILLNLLGNRAVTHKDLEFVKVCSEKTGARKALEEELQRLVNFAQKKLTQLPNDTKLELMRMAEFISNRSA